MVALRLDEDEHTFLILDDQGRPIGRILDTDYALDRRPPEDTVFLHPEPGTR